jgi:hypothetical protein
MRNLTKQWFDEVKKDDKTNENNWSNKSKFTQKTVDNKTYHKLNAGNVSNILLETSDEEENSENEQIIIDKTKFSNTQL